MKISVQWLLDFIKLSPPYERVAERLTMAGLEVEHVEQIEKPRDLVLTVEVTTNRPDWLSHLGVAREIAAVENLPFKMPEVYQAKDRKAASGWRLQLKEAEGCPYYTGVLIEGISNHETPDFIKRRLQACGQRSIDLMVDITNYVLLETGQPLHVFDADQLQGKEIKIRRARDGEKMIAIDGTELSLNAKDLVIGDHDRAVALAGVMGGKETEVNAKTRNVFLESAFFHPQWVRQSSRRLGLPSESSYRFERRVDPEGVDLGRERALWLIQKYAKPQTISMVIKAGRKPTLGGKSFMLLNDDLITKTLGITVKRHQVMSILTRLGLDVSQPSPKSWKVKVPSFRPDLTRPIDLVEEIARLYGFDHIPETLPARAPLFVPEKPLYRLEQKARQFMSGIGLHETITFSLISDRGLDPEAHLKEAVGIVNPQNKELRWMRPVMFPSQLDVIKKNQHAGTRDVFLFEIAALYRAVPDKGKRSTEEKVLGMALSGAWRPRNWADPEREVNFYDLKGMTEAFLEALGTSNINFTRVGGIPQCRDGAALQLTAGFDVVGYLGEIHPKLLPLWELEKSVFVAEIYLERLLPHVQWIRPLKELPRFPAVERDLSVVVPEEVKSAEIARLVEDMGEGLIRQVEVFDFFHGGRIPKGFKNLGFRVLYQSREKTLVSSDIQALHTSIADQIAKKFHASFQ